MKYIASFIAVLLIAALFYYFSFQRFETDVVRVNSVNQVSVLVSSDKEKNTTELKKKPNDNVGETIAAIQIIDNDSEPKEKSAKPKGYINAYRDWQYFYNCYTDVEDFLNNKDPLQSLIERFENNPRESQSEPTAQQNIYYQHHVDICKEMIENEEDDFSANIQRLEAEFREIIPNTEEEKQLQQALLMQKQLYQLNLDFTDASSTKSSLNTEQLQDVNRQIAEITQRLLSIYEGKETLSEEENQLLQQYSQELDELNSMIYESQVVDGEAKNRINDKINQHLINMEGFLKGIISPDAFLIIAGHLFHSEYYQKDSPILVRIKQETKIWDSYYIDILNKITMPLIACSMDYPCDAESDYMLSYCLGLRDSMFNQACGLGLEDFYFNFYIGANQLNDVNVYFQYMVETYGQ